MDFCESCDRRGVDALGRRCRVCGGKGFIERPSGPRPHPHTRPALSPEEERRWARIAGIGGLAVLVVVLAEILTSTGGGGNRTSTERGADTAGAPPYVAPDGAAPESTTAARPRQLSRAAACRHLARFVNNYNYIEQGTSVRAYDTLLEEFQRSCTKEAINQGFVGNANEMPCRYYGQNRFHCQALHDSYVRPLSTQEIVDLYSG